MVLHCTEPLAPPLSLNQGLSQVAPFSLVNEINLLTVLDSFKLFEATPGS